MSKRRYCITATAFDSKGRVIATRTNQYNKTHPLQKHFAILAGEPYKEALHSEIACLIACKDTSVDKMVIVRYDSSGRLKLAKPCKVCTLALKTYGVREVHYSTEFGMQRL